MENENIMENNEVMDVAENVVTSGSGTGLKLVGGAIYVGIKLFKKLKAKKMKKEDLVDVAYTEDDECDED